MTKDEMIERLWRVLRAVNHTPCCGHLTVEANHKTTLADLDAVLGALRELDERDEDEPNREAIVQIIDDLCDVLAPVVRTYKRSYTLDEMERARSIYGLAHDVLARLRKARHEV